MSNDNNMNTKDFFIGALLGGMVGAATALMLAPKSGKELREELGSQAVTAKERTSELTHTALEKGTVYAAIAKEKSNELSKALTDQSAHLVARVKDLTESVRKDVEQLNNTEYPDHSQAHLYEAVTDGDPVEEQEDELITQARKE